jgi:hypothetical protein
MLGRASGGPPPDDRAGNVIIENAEPTEPGSSNQLVWKLLGARDKMLYVGQVLYDIDPRYRGRSVEVSRVEERCLVCKCGPREVIIRRDRVHSDGEQRRSGYSIAPPTAIVGKAKPTPEWVRLRPATQP